MTKTSIRKEILTFNRREQLCIHLIMDFFLANLYNKNIQISSEIKKRNKERWQIMIKTTLDSCLKLYKNFNMRFD